MVRSAAAPVARPLRGVGVPGMTTGAAARHPGEGDLHIFVVV